ncbi:MAG: hypothetical protein ACK6A7_07040, partial [Planctomycetota bacterium]
MANSTQIPTANSFPTRRLVRLRPTQQLGDQFPAMHLVRSGWFARALSRALLALMILMVFAAIFLPWQQTSRGEGQVVARLPQFRLQPVESPAKGIIFSLREDLREGSIVEENEVIMVIKPFAEDAEKLTREVVVAQQQKLDSLRLIYTNTVSQVTSVRDQAQQEIATAEAEVRAATNAWEKATRDVEAQEPKFNQAKLERERYQDLKGDVISERQLKVFDAQQKFRNAAIKLAIFLRDDSG